MKKSICWMCFIVFVSAVTISGIALASNSKAALAVVKAGKYSVAGIDNDKSVDTFLNTQKEAAAKDQRKDVASMINYPMRVVMNGKNKKITNAATFIKYYDKIFTPKVKKAIAAQKESDLFVNYQGVMIGDGEVWFGLFGDKLLIKTINPDYS